MSATSKPSAFACVRIATTRERAEWIAAEVFAAGASGLEERDDGDGIVLLVYVPVAQVEAVRGAAQAIDANAVVGAAEAVVTRDWPETWKEDCEVNKRTHIGRPTPAIPGSCADAQRTAWLADLGNDPGAYH